MISNRVDQQMAGDPEHPRDRWRAGVAIATPGVKRGREGFAVRSAALSGQAMRWK
jgi:hypothetical protein